MPKPARALIPRRPHQHPAHQPLRAGPGQGRPGGAVLEAFVRRHQHMDKNQSKDIGFLETRYQSNRPTSYLVYDPQLDLGSGRTQDHGRQAQCDKPTRADTGQEVGLLQDVMKHAL